MKIRYGMFVLGKIKDTIYIVFSTIFYIVGAVFVFSWAVIKDLFKINK